jgi:hypothetical protein
MSNGSDAINGDFKTFAKAEAKRVEETIDGNSNEKRCYWYATDDLTFKRSTLWDFFTKMDKDSPATGSCGQVMAVKRAVDTVAAFDRAYKFRRQARLDNVPRQDCIANMDFKYWEFISDALAKLAETT